MFKYLITVRGYEIDSFGHVNNAIYLNYMEQARWEILREMKLLNFFKEKELFLAVIDTYIKYSREVKIFDNLQIETTIESQAPYLVFNHKIINTKTNLKIAKARVKTLLVDYERIVHDIPEVFLTNLQINS